MAAPTMRKVWQFCLNLHAVSGGDFLFQVKQALKGFAQSAWTVRGSSNSVAGAMDSTDRWVATANVVRGANTSAARSWIVLRRAGSTFEWLIDYVGADNTQCMHWFSPGGLFTGGSHNARPTAADEYAEENNGPGSTDGFWDNLVPFPARIHVIHSTDGKATHVRALRTDAGNTQVMQTWWAIAEPLDTPSGWTQPNYVFLEGRTPNLEWICGTVNNAWGKAGTNGGGSAKVFATTERFITGGTLVFLTRQINQVNDINGKWPYVELGLEVRDVGALFGHIGYLPDVYNVPNSIPDGDHFPGDGSKTWVKHADFIFPWQELNMTVTGTSPMNGLLITNANVGGPALTYIEAVFSTAIDPASVSATTFVVSGNSYPITGYTVNGNVVRALFEPFSDEQVVTVSLKTTIRGLNGAVLAAPYNFGFTLTYD